MSKKTFSVTLPPNHDTSVLITGEHDVVVAAIALLCPDVEHVEARYDRERGLWFVVDRAQAEGYPAFLAVEVLAAL